MAERSRSLLPVVAAVLFAVAASSHLLLGRVLRYAALGLTRERWLLVPVVVLGAFLHERLVRGFLYDSSRKRLPTGFGAPVVALVGVLAPLACRFLLLSPGGAPLPLLVVQAFLVELLLGFPLAWLALAGSAWVSGLGLALLWCVRLTVGAVYFGAAVPFLEVLAAVVTAAVVGLALWKPLEAHRAELMGVES